MASEESVSDWISQLKAGDQAAAQNLWEAYFHRLVGLARKKLQDKAQRLADEEDVALSAFASFCRGAEAGRFPQLQDRDDLWRLLVTITARKAFDLVRDEHRQKRGGGNVLAGLEDSADRAALEQVVGREPTPEFAAQVAEECQRLLDLLGSEELRSVALWKMEGHTSEQIAALMKCAPSTIERKLRRIRLMWAQEIAE